MCVVRIHGAQGVIYHRHGSIFVPSKSSHARRHALSHLLASDLCFRDVVVKHSCLAAVVKPAPNMLWVVETMS